MGTSWRRKSTKAAIVEIDCRCPNSVSSRNSLSLVAHSNPASEGSLESTSFSLGDNGAGKSAFAPNKAAAPRVV